MEDPGPSSAAPEPSPTSPPPEEGDGWVLLPPSEVEGIDDPKVIHWEDLQQELARLWSLSAALQSVRDRKAQLAARLESALEVIITEVGSRSPPCAIPSGTVGSSALYHLILQWVGARILVLSFSARNYSWERLDSSPYLWLCLECQNDGNPHSQFFPMQRVLKG